MRLPVPLLSLTLASLWLTPAAIGQQDKLEPDVKRQLEALARRLDSGVLVNRRFTRRQLDAQRLGWALRDRVAMAPLVVHGELRLTPNNRLELRVLEVLKGALIGLPITAPPDARLAPGQRYLLMLRPLHTQAGLRLTYAEAAARSAICLGRADRHQAGLSADSAETAKPGELLEAARAAAARCTTVADTLRLAGPAPLVDRALAALGSRRAADALLRRALGSSGAGASHAWRQLARIGTRYAHRLLSQHAGALDPAAVRAGLIEPDARGDHAGAARLLLRLGGSSAQIAWHEARQASVDRLAPGDEQALPIVGSSPASIACDPTGARPALEQLIRPSGRPGRPAAGEAELRRLLEALAELEQRRPLRPAPRRMLRR